jgi:hypothetical protein
VRRASAGSTGPGVLGGKGLSEYEVAARQRRACVEALVDVQSVAQVLDPVGVVPGGARGHTRTRVVFTVPMLLAVVPKAMQLDWHITGVAVAGIVGGEAFAPVLRHGRSG